MINVLTIWHISKLLVVQLLFVKQIFSTFKNPVMLANGRFANSFRLAAVLGGRFIIFLSIFNLCRDVLRSTTELSWTKNVVNEYPTTAKSSIILPWLQDILNEPAATPKPSRNTNDLVIRSTTSKPNKATTMNSFWHEWSATQPTNIHEDTQSLNELDSIRGNNWNEHTTTQKANLAPWMVEVLNEYSTTARSQTKNNTRSYSTARATTPAMPSWMQDVLTEYPTTTTKNGMVYFETGNAEKSTFGGGGDDDVYNFGGGNGDLHQPTENRYLM